jgi:hypothetical protein
LPHWATALETEVNKCFSIITINFFLNIWTNLFASGKQIKQKLCTFKCSLLNEYSANYSKLQTNQNLKNSLFTHMYLIWLCQILIF